MLIKIEGARVLERKIKEQLERLKAKANSVAQNKSELESLLEKSKKKLANNSAKFSGITSDIRDFLNVAATLAKEGKVNIPWKSVLLIIGSLIYFINPFDVVPDFIAGLGFVDDLAILNFVITMVKNDIEKFKES
jgi:uncharacterized membrane protein YkvA (DUF1232 family)